MSATVCDGGDRRNGRHSPRMSLPVSTAVDSPNPLNRRAWFDVVVVGGGPAGIGAAVGAGRMGARVALIERHPMLGGMGTAALVNNFCPGHYDGKRLIIGGVFGEIRERLIRRKAIYTFDRNAANGLGAEQYNPDIFMEIATAMCREAGVELFLDRTIGGLEFGGDKTGIALGTGERFDAHTVVDATGDGSVAFRAGVPFTFGRASDHAVMPLTYCYLMGPIDLDRAKRETPKFVLHDPDVGEDFYFLSGWHSDVDEKIRAARERGELSIPRDHISCIASIPGNSRHASVNYGRVPIGDPTDPAQLAAAEEEGKRQVEDGLRFFRNHLPGCEEVELVQLARQIGVRESRQIQGLYTLTGEDALSCRQFDDAIAQGHHSVDIHEPGSDRTTFREIPFGQHYDIPWRCLVPREGPQNLVVGGRCISGTQEAMASFRVSPTVMAIGEAAGVTAASAAHRDCPVRDVGPEAVQERLLATGGILD